MKAAVLLLCLTIITCDASSWRAFVMTEQNLAIPLCKGVLISPGAIVAPASCFFNQSSRSLLVPLEKIRVAIGLESTAGLRSSDERLSLVTRVISHASWALNNDAAVAFLSHCQTSDKILSNPSQLLIEVADVPDVHDWSSYLCKQDLCSQTPGIPAAASAATPSAVNPASMTSDIVLNANNSQSITDQAKAAAVNIIKEAQVKAKSMVNSAVRRAHRGNPKSSHEMPVMVSSGVTRTGKDTNVLMLNPKNSKCPSSKCPADKPAPTEPPGYLDTEIPEPETKEVNWISLGVHNGLNIHSETVQRGQDILDKLKYFHQNNVRRFKKMCKGSICP